MLASARFRAPMIAMVLVGLLGFSGAAVAETPSFVAEQTADDGVYGAPGGIPIDEEAMAAVVDRALGEQMKLLVIAPNDPQPDAEAFALRVRQAADADAALIFDPDGGIWASVVDDYDNGITRAVDGARAAGTPEAAANAFFTELVNEPDRPLPEVIRTFVKITIYLLVLLLLAALAEHLWRRRRRAGAVVN